MNPAHSSLLILTLTACGGGIVGDGNGIVDEVPDVGWTAEIEGAFHDLAGFAEIIDGNTIDINDFSYDGGGLNARLFLVVDGAEFSEDYELTDNLVGSEFANETLAVHIPDQAEFENWDSIVMWCVPAGVSFGMGVFEPPN